MIQEIINSIDRNALPIGFHKNAYREHCKFFRCHGKLPNWRLEELKEFAEEYPKFRKTISRK